MAKKNAPEILYQSEHILAINKKAGVLSIPDRFDKTKENLVDLLRPEFPGLMPVHRLDKETSGVLLFALNPESHKYLSNLFEKGKVEKYYLAIVEGNPVTDSGHIRASIGIDKAHVGKMKIDGKGKLSHTSWEMLERFRGYSLLKVQIHTGRTHQIRVHMQYMGHPLAVDSLYGKRESISISDIKPHAKINPKDSQPGVLMQRCTLHSEQISFTDPGGKLITLQAPLPKDMNALLNQLRKAK